jgi:hypothetical protein
MKKSVSSFTWLCAIVLSGALLTACEPDESSVTGVITFEDVALDSTGYWNGSDTSGVHTTYEAWWGGMVNKYTGYFTSGILRCHNVFEDYGYGSTSWSGMACSNHTDRDSAGYGNQYSVYATSGAGGSATFAVIYSDSSRCTFNYAVKLNSLMINNSTYAYLAMRDGMGPARKFIADDYYRVTISGVNATGAVTDSIQVYLADFREGKSMICNTWTQIPLSHLGAVKSLVFTFASTDMGDWGINTPAYACIDNLSYTLE